MSVNLDALHRNENSFSDPFLFLPGRLLSRPGEGEEEFREVTRKRMTDASTLFSTKSRGYVGKVTGLSRGQSRAS